MKDRSRDISRRTGSTAFNNKLIGKKLQKKAEGKI